jgi:ADP-ribose pyrophosphatase YjhB (NUDIX family)
MSRHYPSSPVLGVGAVILHGNRVLLVKRGREPLKGQWSIPGGVLELGETLAEGLKREILEEVGLEIRVLEIVEVFERINRDEQGDVAYHYVLADYLCEPAGGALRAGDDADAAAWFDREEVSSLAVTKGTPAVIDKAFQMRDRISVAS